MFIKNAITFSALLSAVLASQSVFANAIPFDGIYVTGGVGGLNSNLTVSQAPNVSVATPNGSGGLNIVPSVDDSGFANSVFGVAGVGFNKIFNCRYLVGVRGVADFENASLTKDVTVNEVRSGFFLSSTPSVKLRNSFAILFTPGVVLDANTLVYGLVGPRWGYFESSVRTVSNTIIGNTNVGVTTTSDSGNHSAYSPGITAGLGISRYLTPHFTAGLEYNFTHYNKISGPADTANNFIANPAIGTPGVLTNSVSIKANTNALMLNLAYYFS